MILTLIIFITDTGASVGSAVFTLVAVVGLPALKKKLCRKCKHLFMCMAQGDT